MNNIHQTKNIGHGDAPVIRFLTVTEFSHNKIPLVHLVKKILCLRLFFNHLNPMFRFDKKTVWIFYSRYPVHRLIHCRDPFFSGT